MPKGKKSGRHNAWASKIGLKKLPHRAEDNLMHLLGLEISRQELIDGLAWIMKHSQPNDFEKELIQLLENALVNAEPTELDSHFLLSEWRKLSSVLANEGPFEAGIHWIQFWNQAFELECYLSFWPLFGGSHTRTPKCPDRLMEVFSDALKEGMNKRSIKLWEEMLTLWSWILPAAEQHKVRECMAALKA
jgi:hypothetical protein